MSPSPTTLHTASVPPQPCDQLQNRERLSGVAVSVICVPSGNVPVQEEPQSMPGGSETTSPADLPFQPIARPTWCGGSFSKVAVTWRSLFAAKSVQASVPEQPRDHPVNREPNRGVAVRVRVVPLGMAALQVPEQSRRAGVANTRPQPLPGKLTSMCTGGGGGARKGGKNPATRPRGVHP